MTNNEFVPDSIVGWPRKLGYTQRDGEVILKQHQCVARKLGVNDPYFGLGGFGEETLMLLPTGRMGERVKVGTVSAYEPWQVAIWLNEQVNAYVAQGTMGINFRGDERAKNDELTAGMIGGYTGQRLLVTMEKKRGKRYIPYAGVQAYPGLGEGSVKTAFQTNRTDSLSTLTALAVTGEANDSIAYREFLSKHGSKSERQVVELSRLWRREPKVLEVMGVAERELGWVMMAYLGIAIERAVLTGLYPEHSILLYDTTRKIQTGLVEKFEAREIVHHNCLTPTEAIMSTILAYHYGDKEEWGGYEKELIVGTMSIGTYALSAKMYLQGKGLPYE